MGSYCTIYFDDLEVCSAKSAVPDVFSAIFQESDRLVRASPFEGDDTPEVVYEATRDVILSRLDLLGCTSQIARERLSTWIIDERETWDDYTSYGDGSWAEETAEAIRQLTPEKWYKRAALTLTTRHTHDHDVDEVDRKMRDFESSWLWFDGYESLVGFRALLDANPKVKKITLDISDLIQGGWLDVNEPVCHRHQRDEILSRGSFSPTIILAEGSSDIAILKRSLPLLFPSQRDYFSFFEHKELNVDGGAEYLVKFLKAFAAAQIPLRLVAVFDNDTTGLRAHRQAENLGLPDNMILLRLPDTDLARTYPTIGPQGFHVLDVNGQAASIELYLGLSALTVNGELRRVRWTSYDKSAGAYQGEVEAKGEIRRLFFQELKTCTNIMDAKDKFPELVNVWTDIFAAVGHSAEAAERRTINYRWREI